MVLVSKHVSMQVCQNQQVVCKKQLLSAAVRVPWKEFRVPLVQIVQKIISFSTFEMFNFLTVLKPFRSRNLSSTAGWFTIKS
jgi:hypothetical protein